MQRWAKEAKERLDETNLEPDKLAKVVSSLRDKLELKQLAGEAERTEQTELGLQIGDQAGIQQRKVEPTPYAAHACREALMKRFKSDAEVTRALQSFLLHEAKNVEELLPDKVLEGIQDKVAKAFSDEMQRAWSVPKIVDLLVRGRISKKFYHKIVQTLFKKWDPTKKRFVSRLFRPNVQWPAMPTVYQLDKFYDTAAQVYGLVVSDDGLFAHTDIGRLAIDLNQAISKGLFKYVDDEHVDGDNTREVVDTAKGTRPQSCLSADAANMHVGMKHTSFAHHWANTNVNAQSPNSLHDFALLEKGDTYQYVAEHCKALLASWDSAVEQGGVVVDGKLVPMDFSVCLDQACSHELAGQKGVQ